jgi:ATP-dependent exoDNAse (exonuclease V) beta subunit
LVDPGLYARLKGLRAAQEAAEDRRLLYVAATRARDHLVIIGRNRASKGSWLHTLGDAATVSRAGLRVRDLSALEGLEVAPLRHPPVAPTPEPSAAVDMGAIPAPVEFEVSPSSLDLYVECPARWALAHLLRVPEEVRQAPGGWNRRLAALRGDVIHSLLEDDVADDPEVARSRWSARARAAGCPPDRVEAQFETLWSHLARASVDPALRSILAAEGMAEVGFRIPFENLVLRGKIDRLWFDRAAGEWVVLDYKSGSAAFGPLVAAAGHERQLRAYAWAASQILAAHGHPRVRRGMLYFTALGEPYHYPEWSERDFAELEALLGQIAETVVAPWEEVEAQAIASGVSRPCVGCGYLGRGCRGQGTGVREVPPRV